MPKTTSQNLSCKGTCKFWEAEKPRYAKGVPRCNICEIFLKWEGLFCPCCGYRVRLGPKNKKTREVWKRRLQIEPKRY